MRHLALVLAAVMLLGGGPATAQVATPDPASLPKAPAPFGLGGVALPASTGEVEALFALLPPSIDGERQQPWITGTDRMQVPYGGELAGIGHPMVLGAIDFSEGDFFPTDFTAGDYVAMSMATDEFENMTGGRDGDVAWLQAEITVSAGGERPGTPGTSATMYTMVWGDNDGSWAFTAIADTPARLEALVTAVVAAGTMDLEGSPAATPDG